MKLKLGYGGAYQAVDVSDENIIGVLTPNELPVELTGEAEAPPHSAGLYISGDRLRQAASGDGRLETP